MAKFHGKIGYVKTEETSPGVHSEVVTEKNYKGDLLRNIRRWETGGENANPDINISNRFSVVADAYAYDNLAHMRYILWRGAKWKITNIEIQRPRVILTVGGVYNG